ncbi:OmpA-related protein, partial [mine drainage metagenome]
AQALTSERQVALYLEDHWHVNRHLHLDLGVRYGYDSVPSWQNFVTPQAIVDGIYGPYAPGATETYAQALALGGINIGNYISNGHNRAAQSGLWQPRLGFSYDIEGNGRYVIFGGYAKAYSQNIFDLLSLEQTKAAFAEPTVNFYGGGYSNAGCLT